MTKKMGRPYSENPKDTRLTIRLDKEHSNILEKYANKYGIRRNEAVRRAIKLLEDRETE